MRRPSIRCMGSRALIALAATVALTMAVHPAEKNQTTRSVATLTNGSYRPFLINNIFNYYGNNGTGSRIGFLSFSEGFEFPKGSGMCTVYQDGILWGGYHKGRSVAKVGGSFIVQGIQPGPILTRGTTLTAPVPANAADPKYRVYRVRQDIRPAMPFVAVQAMLDAEEVPFIQRYETVSARIIYDSYVADWNEWPAADGAPFTDVDTNGVYDPAVDVPGQPGADQTLWYVANDMKDSLTQRLAGCPPIGLEMQRTIWGYRRDGALGNTIFISTMLINKSGAPVDSMFITQWSDPDIGDAGDDFVGCDTTLDLSYGYNGDPEDATYGLAVPALGFTFIQGPVVPGSPADTATFLGSRRSGYRELPMSAFRLFRDNYVQWTYPTWGTNGDLQWYRAMRGRWVSTGGLYVDPNTGDTTALCLSGDPVKATDGSAGWVDGQNGQGLNDRSMCMAAGPFTLADGDTQQVVVACVASQGADRLSSITALRSDVRALQRAYRNLILGRRLPPISCSVVSDAAQAAVSLRVDLDDDPVTSVQVDLTTSTGRPVATLALSDDGMHEDGAAADGIWGGTAHVDVQQTGMKAGMDLTYPGGQTVRWPNVLDRITTARLAIASFAVASDNINSDGVPNPGENVRYVFSLRNDSPLDLPALVTTTTPLVDRGQFAVGTLRSHAMFEPRYDPGVPSSYFVFDVPAGYRDPTIRVSIETTDDSANVWRDTLVFPVKQLPGPVYTSPLDHVAGKASGAFTIRIADPASVKDHLYVIRGVDSAVAFGSYALKDSTTGAVLLGSHPPPDILGHTSPVVDGFKVLLGSININPGMSSWEVPQGVRRFSASAGISDFGLEGFSDHQVRDAYDRKSGTIGAGMHLTLGGIGSTIPPAGYHTVLLKLAAVDNLNLWDPRAVPSDTNFSRAYRYLAASTDTAARSSFTPWIINKADGFPYQDFNYGVPFSAWDMDVTPPQRLAVGHLERNTFGGVLDGRYWPGTDQISGSYFSWEIAFVFKTPYTETPDPALAVNLANNATTPLMWVMACPRRAEVPWSGTDQFKIIACAFPTSQDAWVFDPTVITGVQQADRPSTFALLQNYPNPFNPSTTIRYDLPAQSEVTITVYDILGRAVRHLVRDVQSAGSRAVLWHGDTDTGASVASGVYFYRCTVERSDRGGQFDQTMKMILLR